MYKITILTHILFLAVSSHVIYAQERIQIPVVINGKELALDWNGGYNAPQFSNIDLNRDGVTDLISFDRQGDILRTFIRLPASGRWVMDWSYLPDFPPLVDWVLAADFNGDGVEDLFTSSSASGVAGVTVYKGAYDNGHWSFTQMKDRDRDYLQVTAGGGLTNLYVSWDDIPAITDVDGDGDLDILVFEPGGSYITYFSNRSVESGWQTDSLRFVAEDICWGKILENELSETVYLSDSPDMCSDGNFTGDDHILPRHAGSTILALDADGDGDKDAYVGDIASRRIVFLHNGLNAEDAWIIDQDSHFPSTDIPVDLPFFVAAYSVQVDDDPEPELIAAVNSRSLTEDNECVWRYDDDPAAGPLDYKLTIRNFLQEDMIDVGSHSRPAIGDVNGDGLSDLLLGGYAYAEGTVTRVPSLWLFQNQGTPTQPYFVLVDGDYLGMSQYGSLPTFDFAPAFGDIDGNGSVDLVVGEQNGKIFFYRNTAAQGQPMAFDAVSYPYMNIAIGVSATPQIVDINGDGLGDLVVGERTGNSGTNGRCSNLNYFENIGTAGNASFNPDVTLAPNTQCFGQVLFDLQVGLPQYSTPCIVRTQQGLIMLTGSDPGFLLLYDHVENGKTGALTLVDDHYGSIDAGNRSAPVLADLNADGVYELIVGNQRGGLELFGTQLLVGYTNVSEPNAGIQKPFHINGSLGSGVVDVTWVDGAGGSIKLYDMVGRAQIFVPVENGPVTRVDITAQPAGVYLLQITSGDHQWVEKIVKE